MKPAAFTYHRPASLDEVLALFAKYGDDAKLLAGGQSMGPMMNLRMVQPEHIIDISRMEGHDEIKVEGGNLVVGALARHHDVANSSLVKDSCPVLAQAAGTVGHYAIRQRGTLGGSLAHADPAAQLPLVAVLLNADIEVTSAAETRSIPARDFFVSIMTTALEPDQMVTNVKFPCIVLGEGWGFHLFTRRAGDFAIVTVAATVTLDGNGKVSDLRLVLGGTGPVPMALLDLAEAFKGRLPDVEWVNELTNAAAKATDPDDDPRIPAEYRRDLVRTLLARALADCVSRCQEGQI